MNANVILLQKKYARVIELYANKYNVSPDEALEKFYHSRLYQEIRQGISDLHCMSDDYLVEELHDECTKSEY